MKKLKNQVLVDNNVQKFSLRGLSVVEQKFWWALVSLLYDKGTENLTFSRSQIEKLANTRDAHFTDEEFYKQMKSMGTKIVNLKTNLYDDKGRFIIFSVFPTFLVSATGIEVKVSEYFAPWFNNISKNFSLFDLAFINDFKSSYSIELYRYLMRWKNARKTAKYHGFWSIKWDKFKDLMNIPDNYALSDIKRRILEPTKKEFLRPNSSGNIPMKHFEFKLFTEPGYKRKIDRIEFIFSATTKKDIRRDVTPKNNKNIPMSNVASFCQLLDKINLYDLSPKNKQYFASRFNGKEEIKKLYGQCSGQKDWTDMTFLVVLLTAIEYDKPIVLWAFQDIHSGICTHRVIPYFETPKILLDNLSHDERLEFDNFKNNGLPPSYFKK